MPTLALPKTLSRIISLLSCLGKLMERCIHKYLYNDIISNKVLSPYQPGLVQCDSIVNQLSFLYNYKIKALDEGKEKVIMRHLQGLRSGLAQRSRSKLSSIGIQGSLLDWFSSYLSDRKGLFF